MAKKPVKRAYRSEVRKAAAEGTKAAITAAARKLFTERGFAATPIEAIAREAGVAVPTVYAVFGNKRAILVAIMDTMDQDAAVDSVYEAMARGTVLEQRDAVVAFLLRMFTKGADVIRATRAAGETDPGLRDLAREGLKRHRRGFTMVAEAWHKAGAVREDLTREEAADSLVAITSYPVYVELREMGWSVKRYEVWLKGTINRLILKS